jgi:hypothetical protein
VSDHIEATEDVGITLPDGFIVDGVIPDTVVHLNSMIGAAFRATNDKRARSHQKALGMSELGGCRRQAGFKVHDTPESNPSGERTDIYADSREAMIGSLIHDLVLPQIAEMSMTAEIERPVVLRFSGLPEIPGHVDMVDEDLVVDVKCTSADTTILLADGRVLRADEVKVDDRVVAYDQIHDQLMVSYIASVEENGDRPTIEIITESGRVMRVTDEHPIWIRRSPDALGEWVPAAEIERGMLSSIALTAPVETPQMPPLNTADDPWLLGMLAAIQFRPKDIPVLSVDEVTRSVAMTSVSLMGESAAEDMWRRNAWIGLGYPTIPEEILMSGGRVWQEWLSGYSSVAMTLGNQRVTWSVVNRKMADQIAAMLAALGIKVIIEQGDISRVSLHIKDDYGLQRLANVLWLRGNRSILLRSITSDASVNRPDGYGLDPITKVIRHGDPTRTLAIEVAEYHTFVTGGLVTHNTVGSNSARYYQTHGASKKHLWQTHGYAQALNDAGHPIHHIALAYVDRSNGQVVHIHYQPFDPGVVFDIEQWWREVALSKDPMSLPRDERGPGISKTCDWCSWLKTCWGESAKPGEVGAQNVVIHEASDRTTEVEKRLAEYTAAAQAEKDAVEAKKYARAVLVGTESGQYGSFTLTWGNDTSFEVLDAEAAEKALTAAGLPVPKVARARQGAIGVKRTT